MILGFTGTRAGLTPQQREGLASVFAVLPDQLMHGGAVGAPPGLPGCAPSGGSGRRRDVDGQPCPAAQVRDGAKECQVQRSPEER